MRESCYSLGLFLIGIIYDVCWLLYSYRELLVLFGRQVRLSHACGINHGCKINDIENILNSVDLYHVTLIGILRTVDGITLSAG